MYGTLERLISGRARLHFTRRLAHSPDKVWRAITEPDHLAAWFPTTIEGPREAGARLRFSFPAGEGEPFEGEMLVFNPPREMEFRWGTDIIRLELRPTPGGTELSLFDTLEHGKAARDGAGWHVCLDALEKHLNGEANSRQAMDRWSDVHGHYVEAFGPEAATVGPPGS